MKHTGTGFSIAIGIAAIGFAGPLHAGTVLTLSDFSSDETSAEVLDATLAFSVTGSVLTLSVSNETSSPNPFDLSAIYFNATPEVSGLALTGAPAGWELLVGQSADGFGTYDFALQSDLNASSGKIASGDVRDFIFDISGSGPFLETFFTTEFSTIPPGEIPGLVAAKFVSGPNDDSAFGVTVPEPATLVLMLGGMLTVGLRKRHATSETT